ncbi:MAG: TIR domain-containing protein [Chloroflexota bacterium]
MVGGVRRSLKVFLCHASGDKPPVREFYKRLISEGVDAWLDKEKLLPGQDWRVEIPRAVEEADVVIVFLSNKSVTKEGYVQKEIKFALDIAEEKPEGTIFLIPARIEECAVPERLSRWQWVDLYEEDGYAKLLRSLKLRADKMGAVIEPAAYVDTDKERERRLDQLYTEGLAAFYTEEWDKACQRFRAILSEQPSYAGATEKLAEAERQRNLAALYSQAVDAVRSENWQVAIKTLDELCQKSTDYKDVAQLLKNARRQRQLKELYSEAKTLHIAQKWQAVVKVFGQISVIDPTYPDPDELLPSAQKEVAELNRLAELNDTYSHAVREMDSGQWASARNLLERIHKSQRGFLETERLLRKAETEIEKVEQERARNDQVNTLYEQAHGLMRAKKWRKAAEKIEEIKGLDEQFVDRDEIFNKAKLELEREEGETQRENELAAMYAEAVRLLKEEKYQEALDKWQEVKGIDPKYPDRQWVQRTARKKLTGPAKSAANNTPRIFSGKIRIEWLIFLAVLGFGLGRAAQLSLGSVFPMGVPREYGWAFRGMLEGVIVALVLRWAMQKWNWKAIPIFAICWLILYFWISRVILNLSSGVLTSTMLALAPALSIIVFSLWTEKRIDWSTDILIFTGWILAWRIGSAVAGYLQDAFPGRAVDADQWSTIRWTINDILAGGIGLWITIDLLTAHSRQQSTATGSAVASKPIQQPERLLLLALLSTAIVRAVWGPFQDWLHIWDAEVPTAPQAISLFVLGGGFGVVVALSLRKVIPAWDWKLSSIVIAGWALGFGMAILALQVSLDFNAVVVVLWGLSAAIAMKWAKPSISPLRLTLIFISWALARNYGNMLGDYLRPIFNTDYVGCISDAVTILLGLFGTFILLDGDPKRLFKLALLSALGFGTGNFIATLLTYLPQAAMPLPLAVWGFVGGVVFVSAFRDWKRMLVMGGLCALGLLLGYFATLLLMPPYGNMRNIIWGLGLGIALGLPTRRISVISLLAILSSAIFTITSIYMAGVDWGEPWESTLRGALIGLVLGSGYAYVAQEDGKNMIAANARQSGT